MNFLEQARNVQSVGAANSKNDTVLAHITPKEAAILKLLGGSGRRDPKTGALHFEENDDNEGYSDNDEGSGWNDNSPAGGGKSVGGWGEDPNEEAKDFSDAADALAGNKKGTSYGSRGDAVPGEDDPGYNTYPSGATAPYREALTPDQIAEQQKNYEDTMNLNRQMQAAAKPKSPFGWGTLGKLGVSAFTMNPAPAFTEVPKAANYFGDMKQWGAENARLGLTSDDPKNNVQTMDRDGGNKLGYTALGSSLGSAALGGGLGYALGSVGSSNKSTQMYTDPVTGQLLPYLDAGLNERVANENLDNTIANQLRAQDDLNARRGMGMSTMQDANRASLGLSTAQTRNANRLTAQEIQAQRDLAAQTAAKQDALAQANLRYLQGVQDDANRNAWIKTAGDVAGSIDWDSLF